MSRLLAAAAVLVPSLATAEIAQHQLPETAALGGFVAGPQTINDLQYARQVIAPVGPVGPTVTEPGTAALAQSRIIYLNKNGVTLSPGANDARTNRSTIASQQTTIAAWTVSPTIWTATVACMNELFAPFDVRVTDTDPGNVPHIEAVFGGSPGQLGMPNNVAGVSPFTTDCSVIENSIVFTFTNVIPADARLACEIMAQEVAHSYGLDHVLLASDPMTYLDFNGNRTFKNQSASCGEDVQRPCGINGQVCRPNQNSVALLTERLGPKGGDTVPPTANITSPSANAVVPPGFTVYADATDNGMVTSGKLHIDGVIADTISGSGPFMFTTPATLAEGSHRLKIEVTDGVNVVQTQEITVTVQKGATPPSPPGMGGGQGTDGGDDVITGGCSSSHGGSSAALLLIGLIGLRRRSRRSRR